MNYQSQIREAKQASPHYASLRKAEERNESLSRRLAELNQELRQARHDLFAAGGSTPVPSTARGRSIGDEAAALVEGGSFGPSRGALVERVDALERDVAVTSQAINMQSQIVADLRETISAEVAKAMHSEHEKIAQTAWRGIQALAEAQHAEVELFGAFGGEGLRPASLGNVVPGGDWSEENGKALWFRRNAESYGYRVDGPSAPTGKRRAA